jgi:ribosomal protein S27AE
LVGRRESGEIKTEGKVKKMLTHKQCPKCKGNIYSSADYYGRYEQCLQCGYTLDLDTIDEQKQKAVQIKEKSISL